MDIYCQNCLTKIGFFIASCPKNLEKFRNQYIFLKSHIFPIELPSNDFEKIPFLTQTTNQIQQSSSKLKELLLFYDKISQRVDSIEPLITKIHTNLINFLKNL